MRLVVIILTHTMDRDDILKKIENIREELARDQYQILTDKILERRLNVHKSARNPLLRRLIHKLRSKLKNEIELVLGPVLDNQLEINLRFLEELERLKRANLSDKTGSSGQPHERENTSASEKDQE